MTCVVMYKRFISGPSGSTEMSTMIDTLDLSAHPEANDIRAQARALLDACPSFASAAAIERFSAEARSLISRVAYLLREQMADMTVIGMPFSTQKYCAQTSNNETYLVMY